MIFYESGLLRVLKEREELDARLEKLSNFLRDQELKTKLNPADLDLLFRQRSIMTEYSDILSAWIERFEGNENVR